MPDAAFFHILEKTFPAPVCSENNRFKTGGCQQSLKGWPGGAFGDPDFGARLQRQEVLVHTFKGAAEWVEPP